MNPIHVLARATLSVLAVNISRTAALDGTPIDISSLEGSVLVLLDAGAATAGSTPTLDVKLQHSDTQGGTYTDVTDGAFAQVTDTAGHQKLVLRTDLLKPWVKAVGTLGGTSTPTFPYGVSLLGLPKQS